MNVDPQKLILALELVRAWNVELEKLETSGNVSSMAMSNLHDMALEIDNSKSLIGALDALADMSEGFEALDQTDSILNEIDGYIEACEIGDLVSFNTETTRYEVNMEI